MKLTISRDELARVTAWAARAVPNRPSHPVLSGILLNAADSGTLTVSAYDYEVSAGATAQAEVHETGTVLVAGRMLAEIVKTLPDADADITGDGTRVMISCGRASFTLMQFPRDDYPSLPEQPPLTGTVGAGVLADAVAQVAVAAGRDDTLPSLTGVRVDIDGDTLTLVATDRYRLAVRELRWTPASPGATSGALIPARILESAAKAMTAADTVAVSLGGGNGTSEPGLAGFTAGDLTLTTRLLAGEYPKYRTLIPPAGESTTTAEIDAAAFTATIKRVALVAERNTPVRLTFADGSVLAEAGTGDEAQAAETLPCEYTGEKKFNASFNPQYLVDGVAACGTDVVRMSFTKPARPAVITPAVDDPDYRYVIMPIRSAG